MHRFTEVFEHDMSQKSILIICPYPVDKAPSQRLKYEQYFPHFKEAGYKITVKPFMSESFWDIVYLKGHLFRKILFTTSGYIQRIFALISVAKYDIVYIHLWVTPFGFSFFERMFRLLSKKLIYDIDDMVFLGHSSKANKLITHLKGKGKMIYLMKKADHVITCTPTLDAFVNNFNSRTTDISSTINTDIYKPKNLRKQSDKIILGWSGSHSTSKYLLLLEPVFEALIKRNKNFEILVIGDKHFKFQNALIPVKTLSWNLDTEVEDLSQIDIGLYPLPNEQWVMGKSGLKALQYMALGIPTIASKIGANHRIIESGENGFLIEIGNNKEWATTLIKLMDNESLRKNLGVKARKTVIDKYSIRANKSSYLKIFNQLSLG